MHTPLCQSERRWGGTYALAHFLVIPPLLHYINTFLHLPGWALTVCSSFLLGLFTAVVYRRFLAGALWAAIGNIPRTLGIAAAGLVLYLATNTLFTAAVKALYPAYLNLNDGLISSQLQGGRLLMILAVVITTPLGEEAIFRGLLFRGIYDRTPLGAWLISVGLFSAIHIVGYIGLYTPTALLLAFLQYLPAGMILCLSYRLSGSFLCSVLIHSAINLIGVIVAF